MTLAAVAAALAGGCAEDDGPQPSRTGEAAADRRAVLAEALRRSAREGPPGCGCFVPPLELYRGRSGEPPWTARRAR